jgi:hypothetical protein
MDSVRAAENTKKSRLVIVRNPDVLGGENASEIKTDILATMLDQAVVKMTGLADAEAAWKSLFKPDDVVGIKINGSGRPGRNHESGGCLCRGHAVLRVGVKPSNVMIWENRPDFLLSAGFKLNKDGDGIRVVAVGSDWEEESTQSGSINGRLAKVLTRRLRPSSIFLL